MNPLAEELNQIIQSANIHIFEMLSQVGKNLYFPKGILTQSAEAKEKAHKFNATIGMATEGVGSAGAVFGFKVISVLHKQRFLRVAVIKLVNHEEFTRREYDSVSCVPCQ